MKIHDILQNELNDGRDFSFAWRIFLDQFYAASKDRRKILVESQPRCLDNIQQLAYCAAGVHKLCREHEISVPEWVMDQSFILDKPYFPGATTDMLKLVCLVESPPEFKMRNIFTTENALSRT